MANLEDIKTILLESRQAWAAAHKELLSAVKSNKATNTKAAGREAGGRGMMPDLSGIMPQDIRQIFSSFQNTLRQIFGGTSLAKFETTLKNTIGRAVGSQGSNFFKQFSATAAGAAAASRIGISGNTRAGDITPSGRYGWRWKEHGGIWNPNFSGMPIRGFAGQGLTKKEKAKFEKFGWLSGAGVFKQGQGDGIDPDETTRQFKRRVFKATRGIRGLTGGFDFDRLNQKLVSGQWVGGGPFDPHPGNPAPWMKTSQYLTNRMPMLGRVVDSFKYAKDMASQQFGSLFQTRKPFGPANWNNLPGSQILGELGGTVKNMPWRNMWNKIPGSQILGELGGSLRMTQAGQNASTALGWGKQAAGSVGRFGVGVYNAGSTAFSAARAAGGTAAFAGGRAISAGVGAGMAALGLSNPVGWAVTIALAVPAIAGFTEMLYKSQSGLKDFSAGMATVFARSDLAKLKRNLISSERRSMVAGWLQTQSDAFKDKMLWIWDGLFNVVGTIAAGLLWIINIIGSIYDLIKSIWNWLKSWFVKDPVGIDMGPLGNTLKEFGMGRANALRSPGLFDWGGA